METMTGTYGWKMKFINCFFQPPRIGSDIIWPEDYIGEMKDERGGGPLKGSEGSREDEKRG